mmetsp:Transcript_23529/g.36217  ORF Transcript_23529/g.36217 Transcript_23529/m.36217 type:complete len:133 (+) Transcript_23529:1510-1908(+)
MDVSDVLYSPKAPMSDIFVIGLQEMVALKWDQVIKEKNRVRTAEWQEVLQAALDKNSQGTRYIPIIQKVLVGCNIIMFIRDDLKRHLRNIRKFKVKTGFSGIAGNKGAVALRFNFDFTSFVFINSHMESGQS